jgi:hypothetical protein
MSVTTSGPFTPVVRRITPSGEVNFGEPSAGETQPFTHVVLVSPRRGGGEAGGDGGSTGAALVDVVAMAVGVIAGGAGVVGFATLAPPSHPVATRVATASESGTTNLGIRVEGMWRTGAARIPPDRGC